MNTVETQFKIFVNGRTRTVTTPKLTFDQVVALAFDNPPKGENVVFTITYRRSDTSNTQGTLTPGNSVEVTNGMIFNVTPTDKS